MKNSKSHIIQSWILLICFIAGQYMVYVHQHKLVKTSGIYVVSHNQSKQTVSEKCQLCDAMHHTSMIAGSNAFFTHTVVVDCVYQSPVYNFTSLALILSGGRAPPTANYSA
ncbi:MAG: hypothetical protein ABIN13_18795 [Mucilaginibacter sp.]